MTEFEMRLTQAVVRIDSRLTGVENVARVSAGATLETWAFDALGADLRLPLILRRAAGMRGHGALSLSTEARVIMAARQAGVRTPQVLYVLEESDGLRSGFFMNRIDGLTIPRKILRDSTLDAIRPRLVGQCARILASIHGVDRKLLPEIPVLDAAAQFEHLRAQHRAGGEPRPVFEWAFRWLGEHFPAAVPLCLVHGDFRNGNMIIDATGVRAVLDWEVSHLGDPVEDLAWMCLTPWRFGEIERECGGLGSQREWLSAYESATKSAVDVARFEWWSVFGSLRWGVNCAEMASWVSSGRDPSVERAMIARRASESELDLLRLLAPRY